MTDCGVDGCEKTAHALGLCPMHYQRRRSGANNLPTKRVRHPQTVERILGSIDRAGSGGCWIWQGSINAEGYGTTTAPTRRGTTHAHLAVWWVFNGSVQDGLQLDHLCHTADSSCLGGNSCRHRRCVNPEHLEPVTPRENTLRARAPSARFSRRTHCDNGHPLEGQNLAIRTDGARKCRTCHAAYMRRWNAERKA